MSSPAAVSSAGLTGTARTAAAAFAKKEVENSDARKGSGSSINSA
jgi:hypothetical protein